MNSNQLLKVPIQIQNLDCENRNKRYYSANSVKEAIGTYEKDHNPLYPRISSEILRLILDIKQIQKEYEASGQPLDSEEYRMKVKNAPEGYLEHPYQGIEKEGYNELLRKMARQQAKIALNSVYGVMNPAPINSSTPLPINSSMSLEELEDIKALTDMNLEDFHRSTLIKNEQNNLDNSILKDISMRTTDSFDTFLDVLKPFYELFCLTVPKQTVDSNGDPDSIFVERGRMVNSIRRIGKDKLKENIDEYNNILYSYKSTL